jgi:hypothetical protein
MQTEPTNDIPCTAGQEHPFQKLNHNNFWSTLFNTLFKMESSTKLYTHFSIAKLIYKGSAILQDKIDAKRTTQQYKLQ